MFSPMCIRDSDEFLFISSFTNQDSGTDVFAKIGNSIDSFLHGKEITATVLGHYIIELTDIFRQFRNFLADGIYCQSGNCSCSVYVLSLIHI